ncbi:MAG: hypothetical protein GX891_02320 [Clostridiales bacterium]|nr:hypothetical protein [Clostridiales bacterium]
MKGVGFYKAIKTVAVALALAAVLAAFFGCVKDAEPPLSPTINDTIKWPLSLLPDEFLPLKGFNGAEEAYSSGVKRYTMFYAQDVSDKFAAALEALEKAGYQRNGNTFTNGGQTYTVTHSTVGERQSVTVSFPYDYYLGALPEEMASLPLFNGRLKEEPKSYNSGEYQSASNNSVWVTGHYFNVSEDEAMVYSKFIEINGYTAGVEAGGVKLYIILDQNNSGINGEIFVTYTMSGIPNEFKYNRMVAALENFDYELKTNPLPELDKAYYSWVNWGLDLFHASGMLPNPEEIYPNAKVAGYDFYRNENAGGNGSIYCFNVTIDGMTKLETKLYLESLMELGWEVDELSGLGYKTVDEAFDIQNNASATIELKWRHLYAVCEWTFAENGGRFTISAERSLKDFSDELLLKCGNYEIEYTFDGQTYTATANDYNYVRSENGKDTVERCPIFETHGFGDAFSAHIYARGGPQGHLFTKTGEENYLGRTVEIYMFAENDNIYLYYVDKELDITLKHVDNQIVRFEVKKLDI